MKITVVTKEEKDVRYLLVNAGVRYWEDAEINGEEDEDGSLTPCRDGDSWKPLIDLENGHILNWEEGKQAKIHFKVCDAGIYTLLDEDRVPVKKIDGYVPSILRPEDSGYGDYIIMNISEQGFIKGFDGTDLDAFQDAE